MADHQTLEHDIQQLIGALNRIATTPRKMPQKLSHYGDFHNVLKGARALLMADHLLDIAYRLSVEELDVDHMLNEILEKGVVFLPAEHASVGLKRGDVTYFRISKGEKVLPDNYKLSIQKGFTGRAIRTGKTQLIGNVLDPQYRDIYEAQEETTRSELDVPMKFGDEILGVLNAESSQIEAFDESDEKFLETLAQFAAIQIHYASVAEDRKALLQAAAKLQAPADFKQLLLDILEIGMSLVEATDGAIGLIEDETIKFKYALGENAKMVERSSIPIGRGYTGRAVLEKKVVREGDVSKGASDYEPQIASTRSEMDVPIMIGDEVVGVLNFESSHLEEFTKQEEDAAQGLAVLAAAAIRNHRLFLQRFEAANEMAMIGDVTTALLHDMNNRVSLLRALSYDIQSSDDGPARQKIAQQVRDLCDEVLNEMAGFGNQYSIPAGTGTAVKLRQTIQDVLKKILASSSANIRFAYEAVPPELEVIAHDRQLKEVVKNLVINAITAMPNGGEIVFSAIKQDTFAILRLTDQGRGVERDFWERIFDRSFSTKRTARGTKGGGIGLWWCKLYLTRIGGKITIERSVPNEGTTFRLDIPLFSGEEL